MLAIPLAFSGCGRDGGLKKIEETGAITVITRNNAYCYYTYRGQEMGFEYDLAKSFADFLGVRLNIKVSDSWDEIAQELEGGQGDLAAAGLAITPPRLERVDFSRGYFSVQQMLITHKNNQWIKKIADLESVSIHVRRGTSYEHRLRTLKKRGLDLVIAVYDDVPTEDLIQDVAEGKIEATIADSNVALLNRRYYPDVQIAFPIEAPQSLGWAVKRGEKALVKKINQFFDKIQKDGTFRDIYNRYYAYVELFDHLDIKKFLDRMKTRFPRYERRIKEAAEGHGFDWRLVAALIYQESQFNLRAKSFSGVRGLMQLTLTTAMDMGVTDRLDPEESIMGGVKYLRLLYDAQNASPEPDRTLIAFAAYNVGMGHVLDAMDLASRMSLDPDKWASLEKTLPLLSNSKYYKKSRFGYCRGSEPVRHIQRIQTYYDILKSGAIEYASQPEQEGWSAQPAASIGKAP